MAMSEEAKKIKREYLRKWRKNNPEKVRAAQRRYWERKAQEVQNLGQMKEG